MIVGIALVLSFISFRFMLCLMDEILEIMDHIIGSLLLVDDERIIS